MRVCVCVRERERLCVCISIFAAGLLSRPVLVSQGVCRDSDIQTEEIEEGQSSASSEALARA